MSSRERRKPSERDLAVWTDINEDLLDWLYEGLTGRFQIAGHKQVDRWARAYVDDLILEVGCGHGHHLQYGVNNYGCYIGLDIEHKFLCTLHGPLTLAPGENAMVPTGFAMALPIGFEAQVRPRSGLAAKHGVSVLNTPGTIDADYRGEVKVILVNFGKEAFVVARGERIAQMIIAPITVGNFKVVSALGETERGAGGFGSTGKK